MEKIRSQLDRSGYMDPQPLGMKRGKASQSKGVLFEDLGRTKYQTSAGSTKKRGVFSSSRQALSKAASDDASSDDGLDMLSTNCTSSSAFGPSSDRTPTENSENHQAAFGSRPRPKSNHRNAGLVNKEESNPAKTSPNRTQRTDTTFSGEPPSNQLVLSRKRAQKAPAPSASPLEELSPNRAKRSKISNTKRAPLPFPIQDDLQPPRLKKRSPKCTRIVSTRFPMATPSPKHSPRKPMPAPFSVPSPRAQRSSTKKPTKSIRRVPQRFPLEDQSMDACDESGDDELALTDKDNNAILAFGGPRPFPMPIPELGYEASKLPIHNNSHEKTRKTAHTSLEHVGFNNLGSQPVDRDDEVDPSTVCPYCDEPWPPAPSPTLLSILERTKRKSYADPRPGNALGLKAPLTAFVELCQRHRFEMTHFPLALARGWPTHLDFAGLPARIKSFTKQLSRLIKYPERSEFWREVRDDAQEVGRTKVVSVSGQYATFERTQPGYYGEQGSIIIHQTLYTLFPPSDIPDSVEPLTPDQFLTRVLVPETAVLLIQEDMNLSTRGEVLRVLDESKKYGLAMFPEQAQGEDIAEIGENLAKERARIRRKELEEMGEADADVKRQVERESKQARKTKVKSKNSADTKGKGKARAPDTDPEHSEKESQGSIKSQMDINSSDSGRPTSEANHGGRNKDNDVSMLYDSEQQTPRAPRNYVRASSNTSWRHRRSPSTSPDSRFNQESRSSSQHQVHRKSLSLSPKPLTKIGQEVSQWVFNYRSISPTSDRDVVDVNDLNARGIVKEMEASDDSDVVVIEDELTPRLKPKPKSRKVFKRTIVCEESDSSASNAAVKAVKPRRRPKATVVKSGDEQSQNSVGASDTLGTTKRKKKGETKERSDTEGDKYGWLLADFSE
ncbi:hypothetical protein K439DRAFT_1408955 [Ramaria rubella]|nr:hypothetical protein K439DRAFT_1408955 [Ramaria rubella]